MKRLTVTLAAFILFGAANVFAQPYDPTMTVDGYDATPDGVPTPKQTSLAPNIYEAINLLLGTTLSNNADTDPYQVLTPNSVWEDLGGGTAGNFAAIGITASNTNTLGVYDVTNPGVFIPVLAPQTGFGFLGSGTLADPFPGGINPFTSGENFGFRLKTQGASTITWDSDPSMNSDGIDHMLAFYLPELDGMSFYIETSNGVELISLTSDTYLIAWEDLDVSAQRYDADYNDTMFLVSRVRPIPEPVSLALFGSGLLGMMGLRRRFVSARKSLHGNNLLTFSQLKH